MFIVPGSREWKAADQFAIDSRRSHSVPETKEQKQRNLLKQDFRNCKGFWQDKIGTAKYFKGTFFDFWRFWQTKTRSGLSSSCPHCNTLFRPKYTAEELYGFMTRRSNYTNYNN